MGMENITGRIKIFIKGIIKMDFAVEQGYQKWAKMIALRYMKDNIETIKNVDQVYVNGITEMCIEVNFKMM